jgi:hypothetical protein
MQQSQLLLALADRRGYCNRAGIPCRAIWAVYKRPATARIPPRTTPAGAMWFAAPVLVAAPEVDDVLEATELTELTTEEPADAAELITEEALETIELSAEMMLELPPASAVDRTELRDAAEELKPLRAEPPTEMMLERPDCSAEAAEVATEATSDSTRERGEVLVVAEGED